MSLFELMGLLSTVSVSLIVILLMLTRLAWYKSFPALFIYTALVVGYLCLQQEYIHGSIGFKHNYALVNNLLDAPLMLLFLTYFSQTAAFRKSILYTAGGFIVFELIVLLVNGFNKSTNNVVLAPGLFLVLMFSAIFFVRYVKLTLVNQKALGKLLMTTSLVLSYVLYGYSYVVYNVLRLPFLQDVLMLYYLVTTFCMLIMAVGLVIERRRVKHLAELNKTREELKAIYGEDDITTALPFEKAVFKFEKGPLY